MGRGNIMANQISEHQSVEKNESTSVYSPSPSEKKAIKLVNKLFHEAKSHRSKYDNKWLKYYKFFRGKQWETDRPSYRHSEVINFVFQQIQSSVPILTDRQPQLSYLPQEPQDVGVVQIMNKMAAYDWKRNKWFMPLVESIFDAHIYGTGFGRVEGEVKDGKGKIDFQSADPFYCFPDPAATDVNKNANYFIYAKPMPVGQAKQKYPKIAEYIKPDLVDLMGGSKTDLGKARYQSPTDKWSSIDYEKGVDDTDDNDTLVIELYIKDMTAVNSKEEGKKVKKLKYPNGRKITLVGNVLAEDMENPYEDEDRFCPFARLQNYILPRENFGISEIEQLESPQMIFNKLVSFTLDVLTLMGNPVWIIDTSSGIDPENLINRPGLVIEKERGSEVGRVEGTQLQPYVLSLIDRMQSWFNDIGGQTDVSTGAIPAGVKSGRAITLVQESAKTRLRLKGRLIDLYLQDIGQMYRARAFQYYLAPQVFRITNDDQSYSFFKVSMEDTEEGNKLIRLKNLLQDDDGQVIDGEEQIYETSGRFDVETSIGSGLPFSQIERADKAYQLFDRGVIDAEALLSDIDYPNKEMVLERMKQKAEEQQAQAAQQAPGAPVI